VKINDIEAALANPANEHEYVTKNGTHISAVGIDKVERSGPYSWSASRTERLVRYVRINADGTEQQWAQKTERTPFTEAEQDAWDTLFIAEYPDKLVSGTIPAYRRKTAHERTVDSDQPLRIAARDIQSPWSWYVESQRVQQERRELNATTAQRLRAAWAAAELPNVISLDVGVGVRFRVNEANELSEALEKLVARANEGAA
jgi:hypothetical protein